MRNNQAIVAPLIIVIAVVLVGAVAFVGYRFANKHDTDSVDTANNTEKANDSIDGNHNIGSNDTSSDTNLSNTTDMSNNNASEAPAGTTPGGTANTTSSGSGGVAGGGSSGSTEQKKSFIINSFNFGYSQTTINVSPGDIVTITLINSSGNHDWVVDEIPGAATKIISSGATDTITFTVPQNAEGKTYTFYCSVGNHRTLGMEGNFVVGP